MAITDRHGISGDYSSDAGLTPLEAVGDRGIPRDACVRRFLDSFKLLREKP
jgi:hypothetical protein